MVVLGFSVLFWLARLARGQTATSPPSLYSHFVLLAERAVHVCTFILTGCWQNWVLCTTDQVELVRHVVFNHNWDTYSGQKHSCWKWKRDGGRDASQTMCLTTKCLFSYAGIVFILLNDPSSCLVFCSEYHEQLYSLPYCLTKNVERFCCSCLQECCLFSAPYDDEHKSNMLLWAVHWPACFPLCICTVPPPPENAVEKCCCFHCVCYFLCLFSS